MQIIRTRGGTLFIGLILVAAALIAPLSLTLPAQAKSPKSGEHLITIHDRGEERSVISDHDTLRGVFKEIGVTVDPNDIVEPGLDTELNDSTYQVNIYRARPVVVVDGVHQTRIMTAYQTPKQIAKAAGVTLHDEDETTLSASSDFVGNGSGIVMSIKRATAVNFIFYGKKLREYTMAKTVGQLLKDKAISIKKDDVLSVKAETPIRADMTIELWRNGKQTFTREEAVEFTVRQIEDASRKVGYRKIQIPGVKGQKLVTYEAVMKNGKEVSKKAIKTVIVEKAKEQVEIVGTKPNFSGDFAAALAKLRSCEGGYSSWNPAGPYYGAYQFDRQTWQGVSSAPYGNATPAEQDAAARTLYERRGWQPWPVCGASLPDIYR